MHVLFATAEYAPLAKVGGLGEAASGLVGCLRTIGVDVDVVVPDYTDGDLCDEIEIPLDVPEWAGPAFARRGSLDGVGEVTLVRTPGLNRPHPYIDLTTGEGWPDNDHRFFAFSAAVAALVRAWKPDILHVNDWHTAATLPMVRGSIPTVITIHNLAYQGQCDPAWLARIGNAADPMAHDGSCNPLAGGVALADKVVVVSPGYASEIVREKDGWGLHEQLSRRGDDLIGIRNGIDPGLWNPGDDPLLPATYSISDLAGKEICRKELLRITGLEADRGPVIGMVCRLVPQKGVDIALELAPFLHTLPARLVITGSGSPELMRAAKAVAAAHPEHVHVESYDEALAHLVVAGSDLLLVPSRFEPCGLTQMQAMTCGTIPVVTGVGGLRDTVIDADRDPTRGTGFVADRPDPLSVLDALHRAVRGWSNSRRRRAVQRRGMTTDWSWVRPATAYLDLYQDLDNCVAV